MASGRAVAIFMFEMESSRFCTRHRMQFIWCYWKKKPESTIRIYWHRSLWMIRPRNIATFLFNLSDSHNILLFSHVFFFSLLILFEVSFVRCTYDNDFFVHACQWIYTKAINVSICLFYLYKFSGSIWTTFSVNKSGIYAWNISPWSHVHFSLRIFRLFLFLLDIVTVFNVKCGTKFRW